VAQSEGNLTSWLELSPEISDAIHRGAAVVALESTIVAHGFPYPDNLDVAHALDAAVRDAGALPAMIAVLDGTARVGLGPAEVARITRPIAEGGRPVRKCSIGDLAMVCGTGGDGATTVSASLAVATAAGIPVFATGGIGGIHRRGEDGALDMSADLDALARHPVVVVCSGAKSLLDLPATVEMLESLGVVPVGFRTSEFPAFYTARGGIPLRHRIERPEELVPVVAARRALGVSASLMVCNPPPSDLALDPDDLDRLVKASLEDVSRACVAGPDVTPAVLDALHRRSAGRTVACNRALAVANARLAGEIAVALTRKA
jgi:pseudouridine-5'-phosphate glycosidase